MVITEKPEIDLATGGGQQAQLNIAAFSTLPRLGREGEPAAVPSCVGGLCFFIFGLFKTSHRCVRDFLCRRNLIHNNVNARPGANGRHCSQLHPFIPAATCKMVAVETVLITVACRVLTAKLMIIEVTYSDSQEFDDSHFFQRLTLIDICCGPPAKR
jgi:hypothetical protein